MAADLGVRTEGIPALELWDVLLGRDLRIVFHEDNQAMIQVCKSGRNPTMRHLGRTHAVDVAWLHERYEADVFELRYEQSENMSADIFTKAFTDKDKWAHACRLINHIDPATFLQAPTPDGGIADNLKAKLRNKEAIQLRNEAHDKKMSDALVGRKTS